MGHLLFYTIRIGPPTDICIHFCQDGHEVATTGEGKKKKTMQVRIKPLLILHSKHTLLVVMCPGSVYHVISSLLLCTLMALYAVGLLNKKKCCTLLI